MEDLDSAFKLYWDNMDACCRADAYWALLHMTICLPDVCAALESRNGRATGPLYVAWCNEYVPDEELTGEERWDMRCRVLHQGRATTSKTTRYDGFSFSQPARYGGKVDHRRLENRTLILDVSSLAEEVKEGVLRWIQDIQREPKSSDAESVKAENVERYLPALVRLRPHESGKRSS